MYMCSCRTMLLMIIMVLLSSHQQLAHGLDHLLLPAHTQHLQEMLIANATNTSSPILLSSDASFAWQFVPYHNDSRLLVVLSTAYNTTITWIANRNQPVSPNASLLLLLPSRRLILRDVNGSVAWAPPATNISSVLMNSTGNLLIQAAQNSTLWQSFDDASDVLVPLQVITTHHAVVSRLSLDDVSAGHYMLIVEPGGAVAYASFDWQQDKVPYALITYAGGILGTMEQALHSACNHTSLIYKEQGRGVALQQDGPITPQCRAEVGNIADDSHGIMFGTYAGGPGFRFMRLMPYGDFTTYISSTTGVAVDNEFFRGITGTFCKLPSFCGVNSLCSSVQNCTCPDLFQLIDPSDAQQGCRLIDALNCSISNQHQFLGLPGVDYFANTYLTPRYVSGPDDCTSLCLINCSCTAAFYNNGTRACHLYDQVRTLQPGSNPAITAFLRVARLPVTSIPPSSRIPKKVVIGATTGLAVFLVSLVILATWIVRSFTNKPTEESDSEEEAFLESLPGLPPRFSYKELHSATEGFSKKLGTGGSGAVYEGNILPVSDHRHRNQSVQEAGVKALIKVAVKELQLSGRATIAASGKKQFRAEVATLGSLSHVNLVQLRGFCAEGVHRLLIYEYLENGSLDRWIFNQGNSTDDDTARYFLPWEVRYRIAVDTARGLAFLHEGSRDKVVHLDVKPQNILIDANFRVKLADFGLCKLISRGMEGAENQTVTAMRGTPGYMAPEWFLNLPVTEKSDVFSYGMVLLELVGGRKNLNLAVDSEDEWYFPAWAVTQAENGKLLDVIDRQLTARQDDVDQLSGLRAAMTRLLHVAFWCIQENAGSRPSMSTVLLMLEEHLQVPNPPLDHTYVLRHQSRPPSTATTTLTTSVSSGLSYSELEPR